MHPEAISKTVLPSPHAPGPTLPSNLETLLRREAFADWCRAVLGAGCEWLSVACDRVPCEHPGCRVLTVRATLGTVAIVRQLAREYDARIRVLGVTS